MGHYDYIQETDTAVSQYDIVESRDGMFSRGICSLVLLYPN